MKFEDVQNITVIMNVAGQTGALKMTQEQKLIIALFALRLVESPAQLVLVPHMTLPEDPAMKEYTA